MSIAVPKKSYTEYKCIEHNKRKYSCKLCKGNAFCEHGKIKSNCKECNGSSICQCGIIKYWCRKCNGSMFCKHGIIKTRCKLGCGGSAICIHNIRKYDCKLCNGSQICIHNNRKNYCKECNGNQICQHKLRRENCKECNGSKYCQHNERKERCILCEGSALCKKEFCKTLSSKKYDGYCFNCFITEFPDSLIVRNYRNKELSVNEFIFNNFKGLNWISNKPIKGGFSKRRPDLFLELEKNVIIIEIDENQHNLYNDENDRMEEISRDLGNKPIIFIRFNPDSYINENGKRVKSCWGTIEKRGLLQVINKSDWDNRLEILKNLLNYWIVNETNNNIEIEYLFYDIN